MNLVKIKTRIKNQDLITEKHRQIAAAAVPLFKEKGFHQTTIREIADAAHISMGLLYKYISSKDDVLYLVQKEVVENNFRALSKKLKRNLNPIEELKESMAIILNLIQADDPKKFLSVYTDTRYLTREALKAVLTEEARMVKHFQTILERGEKLGFFDGYRKKYSVRYVHKYLIDSCLKMILPRGKRRQMPSWE
jgi:TetR/AcrR family transcriptional regulator, cholesterol catabolism regulator